MWRPDHSTGQLLYKLYIKVSGIALGTNCTFLAADLFMFCYESDLMMYLSDDNQADISDVFKTSSR